MTTSKTEASSSTESQHAVGSQVDRGVRPHARTLADHIEQRLRTWRQQHMNRSGDRLALADFMGKDSIADLVDFVCDEYAMPVQKPLSFAQLDAAARDAQIKFCLKSGGSFEEEFARAIERAHGIGA